jgi:hypothetical protein
MPELDPTLSVLAFSSFAAFAAGLGSLPHQALLRRLPLRPLGWCNALAAGLMLGVAYALLDVGLPDRAACSRARRAWPWRSMPTRCWWQW